MKLRCISSLALLTAAAASSPNSGAGGGYYPARGGYHPHQYENYGYNPSGQQAHQQAQRAEPQAVQQQSYKDTETTPSAAVDAIPSPWQEHLDPSSGRAYYYNPESGVTQWERPRDHGDAPVPRGEETSRDGEDKELNVTTGDIDSSSNAFVRGHEASDQKFAAAGGEAKLEGPVDQQRFGMGSYGMPQQQQGYIPQQQQQGSQQRHQYEGQQGQGWSAQDQQTVNMQSQEVQGSGQSPDWDKQQMEKIEQEIEVNKPAEEPIGQNWNMQGQQQSWGQQQPVEEEKKVEETKSEEQQMPPQQTGQTPSWNQQQQQQQQQQSEQVPSWGQQPPVQQINPSEQPKGPQPNIMQQQTTRPGWPSQPGHPQQQPPQQQMSQQQQGPPQWQRQPHPQQPPHSGQQQQQQPPPGYPMRPGYGMPPHMQQPHPMYQQQGMGIQRPPGYGYPQYPYGQQGMSQQGPGAGQLVTQRTEELSSAVKEKWGQALVGLGQFGNRTKELAENAKNSIGESASSAGKAIGETSTGIWGRLRASVDNVKGSIFERNADGQGGNQGYALSQFGVPPPAGQGQRGPPPHGYGGRPGFPPDQYPDNYYPPNNAGYPQQRQGQGFVPRPGYSPPYPHVGPQGSGQQSPPPLQSQWGSRGPPQQGQGGPQMQQGRPQYPPNQQYPPQGGQPNQRQQYPQRPGPAQQQQQQHSNPANHPGWNQ